MSIEKELVLVLDGAYLFPNRQGGLVQSAMSIMNSALNPLGAELPVIYVHTEADRRSPKKAVIARQVKDIQGEVVAVPSDIIALYTEPEDESPEAKESRLTHIKWYFESL